MNHNVQHDKQTLDFARSIVEHTIAEGGGTFDLSLRHALNISEGYIVGGAGSTLTLPAIAEKEALADAIARFIYRTPSNGFGIKPLLGTWVENGIIHVDVSEIVTDRIKAIFLGVYRNQISIWDAAKGEAIYTKV